MGQISNNNFTARRILNHNIFTGNNFFQTISTASNKNYLEGNEKMRVRNVNYWQSKISAEMNKPTEKRYLGFSSLPKNIIEEQNYEIAEYFVKQQQKKLVA